MICLYISWN